MVPAFGLRQQELWLAWAWKGHARRCNLPDAWMTTMVFPSSLRFVAKERFLEHGFREVGHSGYIVGS